MAFQVSFLVNGERLTASDTQQVRLTKGTTVSRAERTTLNSKLKFRQEKWEDRVGRAFNDFYPFLVEVDIFISGEKTPQTSQKFKEKEQN